MAGGVIGINLLIRKGKSGCFMQGKQNVLKKLKGRIVIWEGTKSQADADHAEIV